MALIYKELHIPAMIKTAPAVWRIKRPLKKSTSMALWIYQLLWNLALPMLRHNNRLRQGFYERTVQVVPPRADLWIQAASVGEAYLAAELIATLSTHSQITTLLTTNTMQGMDILQKIKETEAKNKSGLTIHTAYFPFDKPSIMAKAFAAIRPKVIVLLESELWPGLMHCCRKQSIKLLVINGRMTEKSLSKYLIWPSLWRDLSPNKILAMSTENSKNFGTLFGNERVEIMDNIKFDRIQDHGNTEKEGNPLAAIIPPAKKLIILGSIRQEEEEDVAKLIVDLIQKKESILIGLFPRHMHRIDYWAKKLSDLSVPWKLRSECEGLVENKKIILWDTMGELSHAYDLAQAAFVGGSLAPVGGQNFMEPLACGLKPVIGPYWSNFFWVGQEIFDQKLVHQAADWHNVSICLQKMITEQENRQSVRQSLMNYVKSRQGGTRTACNVVTHYLEN